MYALVGTVLVVMVSLAYWNSQKLNRQLQRLESSGFVITEDLQGEPKLLYDESHQRLALLSPQGYEVLQLSELISSEILYDLDKRGDKNYRLELIFNATRLPKQEVRYRDEFLAERIHKRLRQARLGLEPSDH
ncbi:hypothetical protein Q8W30_02680 [Neptunomonas phycophila]|uniref:Uncharacterized protein n=1 Tax=Neptunomonas phycophila TaxID=1572645 RepID=A0ABT9EQW9_9GAMM|nr:MULTISPECIES: hypothetical protein [Neptunomonas]MBT3147103.1 hypothetical protein [Neptunomonas phycophila]MDN2658527.1 hypothetical protein [Neptunomonas sp. CHC150]MDP2521466.1 hypothetical protein [Neptunomonas phycophila]QLE98528.1 hypothetical protein FLM49_13255 [Neptunomonas phycophila]